MSRFWVAHYLKPFPATTVGETAFYVIVSFATAVSLSHAVSIFIPAPHPLRIHETNSISMEFITPQSAEPKIVVPARVILPPEKAKVKTPEFGGFSLTKILGGGQTNTRERSAATQPQKASEKPRTAELAPAKEIAVVPPVKSELPAAPVAKSEAAAVDVSTTPAEKSAAPAATTTPSLNLENFNGIAGGDFGAQTLPRAAAPAVKMGNIAPYKKAAFVRIIKHVHQHGVTGQIRVACLIAKDGRLLESSVEKSSGIQALDDDVLAATKAAQFDPLPEWYTGESLKFIFEIKAEL